MTTRPLPDHLLRGLVTHLTRRGLSREEAFNRVMRWTPVQRRLALRRVLNMARRLQTSE